MSTPGSGTARTSALCPMGTTLPLSAGGKRAWPVPRSFPPGNLWVPRARCTEHTRELSTIRWASGRGWVFPSPQPMYVCAIRPEENQVVLGKQEELFARELTARDINLISTPSIPEPMRVKARIRYRQMEQPATVVQTGPDQLRVVFDEPQRAITPGQSLVLYDGDVVVGGGKITGEKNT